MSGQLRTLKTRIKSVENTKKITRAMEMVAAAKLRRFQDMMEKGSSYASGLEKLLRRLSQSQTNIIHPFLETREEKKVGLVFFSSDTGLCGSYNLDLFSIAEKFLEDNLQKDPIICGVGKMGVNALGRMGYKCHKTIMDIRASQVEEAVQELKSYLEELYTSKRVDSIYVVYSHCTSMMNYEQTTEKLLPLSVPMGEEQNATDEKYIFEPDEKTLLNRLIPIFFEAKTRQVFLEAFVSEQIARMRAMHQATENAKEMIDNLVLLRNKVRQAAITKEIIEIVSGSQALKK